MPQNAKMSKLEGTRPEWPASLTRNVMSTFILTAVDLDKILSSLEPSYQQVQKETKARIRQTEKDISDSLSEKYQTYSATDCCYFGLEQIVEKFQADLKVFKNLCFGSDLFFNKMFVLNEGYSLSKDDKDIICQHYMNSMMRSFFLELANLLESFIRDLCEEKGVKANSHIDSVMKKILKLKLGDDIETKIRKILFSRLDTHVSLPRLLDKLEVTKEGTNFRNFMKILGVIRNASHNGFFYSNKLKKSEFSAFGVTYKFQPGEKINASIHDTKYFLSNSVLFLEEIENSLLS